MYAISRLKAAKNAWYWVVHVRRRGVFLYKRFYDARHGGSKKALAAALRWRNMVLETMPVLTLREFHAQRRSNNTSGVPGVHLVPHGRKPKTAWQAKITFRDGRKVTKNFSMRRFGRREAFRLAVAARKHLLELVPDRPFLWHAMAKRFAARAR